MNNHQNATLHQLGGFLRTPLALLGVDLKNAQVNKICHFVYASLRRANHP